MKSIKNLWPISAIRRIRQQRKTNKILRAKLRATGFFIYKSKRAAIAEARRMSFNERQVYWVIREVIGYYVVNMDHVRRLNKNSLKQKGGVKITTMQLENQYVWRSPSYSSL